MAISLKECINVLERGKWLTNLRVITANVKKGTGGKVLQISKARIARKQSAPPAKSIPADYSSPLLVLFSGSLMVSDARAISGYIKAIYPNCTTRP